MGQLRSPKFCAVKSCWIILFLSEIFIQKNKIWDKTPILLCVSVVPCGLIFK